MQIGYQWKGMIFLNPTKVDPTHLELQTFFNEIYNENNSCLSK
jgi:hypothetical protein